MSENLAMAVEAHLRRYFAAHTTSLPDAGLYARVLNAIEPPLLRLTLEACEGNQLKAAEILGLNRNTLRKKLRDYAISIRRRRR